jgi:peptide/nickel transport system substrate-binding protein
MLTQKPKEESMRRTLFLAAFCLVLSTFCFGLQETLCQDQPVQGGTLTAGFGADIGGADPHRTSSAITAVVLNHVFDRLIGYGENLDFVPILAERWKESPDLKSLTFYLRKGRLFHNGREMVAEDVKYSLERIKDPNTGNPRRSAFDSIETIVVVDKYTVRLQLKQLDPTLLSALAYPTPIVAIVPKEEVEKQGGVMKVPVGTGPYKFVEWKPDRYVLLERFDQYKPVGGPMDGHGGKRYPYLDKIKFVPISEESVARMALLNKEIDYLAHVPFKDIEKFQHDYAKSGIKVDEMDGLSWYGLFLGCDKPITKDVKFRQACAYAIDRNVVSQAATRSHATINSSFVAVKNFYYTPAHEKWYPKNIEKARQLLKESGYKGQEIPLLTTKRYPPMYDQAVAFQSELAAAGIQTKLEVLDWPVLLKRMYSGDYQLISFGVSAKPDPALAYMEVKYAGFEEQYPRLKEIREKAGLTLDTGARTKLFEEAHAIIYQGVPAIICYYPKTCSAQWDYVKGYKPFVAGQARFWNVWLDKK